MYSAMQQIVGGPMLTRGLWYGVCLSPHVGVRVRMLQDELITRKQGQYVARVFILS